MAKWLDNLKRMRDNHRGLCEDAGVPGSSIAEQEDTLDRACALIGKLPCYEDVEANGEMAGQPFVPRRDECWVVYRSKWRGWVVGSSGLAWLHWRTSDGVWRPGDYARDGFTLHPTKAAAARHAEKKRMDDEKVGA